MLVIYCCILKLSGLKPQIFIISDIFCGIRIQEQLSWVVLVWDPPPMILCSGFQLRLLSSEDVKGTCMIVGRSTSKVTHLYPYQASDDDWQEV